MQDALLSGEYSPITDEVGFVEADPPIVRDWLATGAGGDLVDVETISGCLAELLEDLLPLEMSRTRRLVVPTVSSWTAIFDNTWRGTDVSTLPSFASDELGCRAVRAVTIPDTFRDGRGRFGASIFTLTDGRRREWPHVVRSVGAVNDGGRWAFDTSGELQPFEEADAYSAPRIRDRLTPERVRRYLAALGVRLIDETFYAPQRTAYLIHERGVPGSRGYTLEEARADW